MYLKEPDMTTVTINNKEYELEALADEAKAQVNNIQFVDGEMARLNANLAVLQTAKMAYINALMPLLPAGTPEANKH